MRWMNQTKTIPHKPLFDPSDATEAAVLRTLFAAAPADALSALGRLDAAGGFLPLVADSDVSAQPNAASPMVLVYPMNEYLQAGADRFPSAKQIFEDGFIRSAVMAGLPVATLVLTDHLAAILENHPDALRGRVLVTPYPTPDSAWEAAILQFARSGGQLLVYGAAVPGKLARQLGLKFGAPLLGKLDLFTHYDPDRSEKGALADAIDHYPFISDGGIDTTDAAYPLVTAMLGLDARVYAARSGSLVWVRGTLSAYLQPGGKLLVPHKPSAYYNTQRLMRYVLEELGISLRFDTTDSNDELPVALFHRCGNALYASIYHSGTPSVLRVSTPLGAPVLTGLEATLQYGEAAYSLPQTTRCEIRAFVKQSEGTILCREEATQTWQLCGLQNADVYWLGEDEATAFFLDSGEPLTLTREQTELGEMLLAQNVTGTLVVR